MEFVLGLMPYALSIATVVATLAFGILRDRRGRRNEIVQSYVAEAKRIYREMRTGLRYLEDNKLSEANRVLRNQADPIEMLPVEIRTKMTQGLDALLKPLIVVQSGPPVTKWIRSDDFMQQARTAVDVVRDVVLDYERSEA